MFSQFPSVCLYVHVFHIFLVGVLYCSKRLVISSHENVCLPQRITWRKQHPVCDNFFVYVMRTFHLFKPMTVYFLFLFSVHPSRRGCTSYLNMAGMWEYFNDACYQFVVHSSLLTWHDAEKACQEKGGHLVSIRNTAEAQFIHFMMTSNWTEPLSSVYIGNISSLTIC